MICKKKKKSFPILWAPFQFLDSVLWNTKSFNFDEVYLSILFSLIACAFGLLKTLLIPRSGRFTSFF